MLSVPFCGYATLFFAELERVDSASNFSSVVHVPKINAEVTKTPLCHPHFPTSIAMLLVMVLLLFRETSQHPGGLLVCG